MLFLECILIVKWYMTVFVYVCVCVYVCIIYNELVDYLQVINREREIVGLQRGKTDFLIKVCKYTCITQERENVK